MISPTVIAQDFPCSGKPDWAIANKDVVATDVSSGIKWRQSTIPSGNNWIQLSKNNIYSPGSSGGDVVGPASAVDERIAVFNGTTGKLIADGGKTIAEILAATSGNTTVFNETPTGLINGVNTVFTTFSKFKTGSAKVWYMDSGVGALMPLLPGTDFTETGALEVTLSFAPPTSSIILMDYILL